MKSAVRFVGYICGIALIGMIAMIIYWQVQDIRDIDYRKVVIALVVFALGFDRLTKR